jgi:nitric oxide synthase oxygenase domain/subunit
VKEQTKESNGGGGVFGRWFGTKNTKNDEDGKTQNTDSSPKENAVEHDFPRNGDGTIESNDPLALKNEDVARPLLDTNSGSEHADHPDLMSSLAHIGDSNGLDSRVSDYTDRFLAPIEEMSDEESSKRSLGFEESRRSLGFVFPPAILEENAAETDTVDEIVYGVSRGKDSLTFTGESGKSTKSSSSGILPSELSGETATKKGSDSLDRKELKSSASSGSSSRYRSKRKKKMKSQETKRSSSSIDQSLLKADQSSTPNGSSDKAKRANSNEQLKRRSSSKFSVLKPLPTELNTEEILRAEKRDRKALLRRSSRSSYGLRKLSSLHSLGISEFSPSTFVRPVANRAGESESSMHSKLKQDALQSLDVIEKDYALDSRRLSPSDSVLIINGWNRIQQCHIFLDALLARWRILVAFDELVATEEARNKQLLSTETKRSLYLESLNLVDENGDPISKCLGARMSDVKRLLVQMLDYEVKSLHSQTHMGGSINRAHIPFGDYRESKVMLKNEPDRLDVSLGERFRVFSRHGIRPLYWVLFCDAFLWGVQNHNPRKNTADFEDLVKPPTQSAYAYFVSSQIAKRAIEEQLYLREQLTLANVAASVKQTWDNVGSTSNEQIYFGEKFLRQLLTNCPELRRYFGKVDMDTIPIHFARTVDMFMANIDAIGSGTFAVRKACYELSSILREHDIPYLLLPVFGWHLIKAFKPFFKQEEKRTKDKENHIKAESLKRSFAFLYSEVMDVVSQSIIFQGKLVTEATSFIYCVAAELDWAADVVAKRLLDVKEEIKITGTYTHTSEEIESGARIAWRNSSRVPEDWKSFEFRDYRKMETPDRIFSAVEEYLNIAKSGTNVRSILAVFKPKSPNYAYGTRFWSSNFINYAGYQDRQGVIGDPETLEFTEFLIQNKLWSPPQKRSEFDILPLVLKMVGEQKPYIHELSKESTHEVAIEHPTFRKIRQLGLRCTGISAISNKSLNLGGLEYQCCPFNGYSISSQVAQKLLKRNGVYEKLAKAMSIAMSERLYKEKVEHELQIAILHSFEKAGYAVRDPEEVAAALSKHCENERLEGRECLSQNPKVSTDSPPNVTVGKYDSSYEYPQFESLCIHWRAMDGPYYEYTKSLLPAKKSTGKESESYSRDFQRPLVLIAFASERGDAESVALRLGRALRVCEPIVKSLDDVKRLNMLTEHPITHFIVLCGTGDSDGFPLVAQSFASTPFAPDLLKNVKFTVLAFGSTLDPNFGQVGKELEKKLIGAGSNAFLPLTTVDGVLGFESFVSDWLGLVKRIVLPEYIQAALSVNDIADRRPSHRIKWLEYVQPTGSIEQFNWPEKKCFCM